MFPFLLLSTRAESQNVQAKCKMKHHFCNNYQTEFHMINKIMKYSAMNRINFPVVLLDMF